LAFNEIAWRLHMANGFQREALFRGHVVKNGQAQDVIGLGLLAEEWATHRPTVRDRLLAKGFSPHLLDTPLAV